MVQRPTRPHSAHLLVLCLCACPVAAGGTDPPARLREVPGVRAHSDRLIARPVQRADTPSELEDLRRSARSLSLPHLVRHVAVTDEYLLRVPQGRDDAEFALELESTGAFEYVEPDWRVHASVLPDDPLLALQDHLVQIDAPAAWELETGAPTVVVAVCDSGVDLDHPDLAGVLVPGYNAPDGLSESEGGAVDGLTHHGTRVAGVAGARGNDGVGVTGVGWGLSIMPIRVSNLPHDTALISDINDGARWAVDHGARVVNVSFSGVNSASVETTGAYVRVHGGLYVWAAGNSATSLGSFDSPELLVVGAADAADSPAWFTNTGAGVDVVAPGVDVFSTELDGWGADSGTSFSAPIASGVLGLVWSAAPGLAPEVAEAVLRLSAEDLGPAGEDLLFGAGRVDAARAVQLALDVAQGTAPPHALDDGVGVTVGEAVEVDVLANDVDLTGAGLALYSHDGTSAAGGVVTLVAKPGGHVLAYTPPAGFEGVDSFGYELAPGTPEASATVHVVVAHVPSFEPPLSFDVAGFGAPAELIARDVDGDGDLDVAGRFLALELGSVLVVYLNQGDGLFADGGTHALAAGLLADADLADLDADGCQDLVVTDRLANTVEVRLGDCDGGFGTGTVVGLGGPQAVAAVDEAGAGLDFDGDGAADVALAVAGLPFRVETWLGDGSGGLATGSQHATLDVSSALCAGDVDGDGRPDLAAGGAGLGWLEVFRTGAGGALLLATAVQTGAPVEGLLLADLDADGDLDIGTSSSGIGVGEPGVRLWTNDGWGGYSPGGSWAAIGAAPGGLVAGDLDHDGDVDLVSSNGGGEDLSVHPALGAGQHFLFALPVPAPTHSADVVAADFDGDGDLDLGSLVVSTDKRLMIHRNITPSPAPSWTSYGCGLNPSGSLEVLFGQPTLGGKIALAVDNPAGTQGFASFAFLVASATPDPAYPCGTPAPGWGMWGSGAPGEVLVGLGPGQPDPVVIFAGLWTGAGLPAVSVVEMPAAQDLAGSRVFVQAVLVDPSPGAVVPIGLSTALELTLGF